MRAIVMTGFTAAAALLMAGCSSEEEPVADRFERQAAEIQNKARAFEAQVENEVSAAEARLENEIDTLENSLENRETAQDEAAGNNASR